MTTPRNTEESGHAVGHSIDPDGFERVHGVRTPERSPEGAPADVDVGRGGIAWIIISAGVAVIAVALIAGFFLGIWAGLVAFLLLGILFCANPAIWAGVMRARERGTDREQQAHDAANAQPAKR
jgi:uncharacterized membrane protein